MILIPDIKRQVVVALAAVIGLASCTEPRISPRAAMPTPILEASLELSDSLPRAGSQVIVSVRLRGENAARVASFTGRVSYDTTGLRYVDELSLADGATRVSNPTPGAVRLAALQATGFASGTIARYRFEVVDPRAVQGMRLQIDELHQLDHADASRSVQIVRGPVAKLP